DRALFYPSAVLCVTKMERCVFRLPERGAGHPADAMAPTASGSPRKSAVARATVARSNCRTFAGSRSLECAAYRGATLLPRGLFAGHFAWIGSMSTPGIF